MGEYAVGTLEEIIAVLRKRGQPPILLLIASINRFCMGMPWNVGNPFTEDPVRIMPVALEGCRFSCRTELCILIAGTEVGALALTLNAEHISAFRPRSPLVEPVPLQVTNFKRGRPRIPRQHEQDLSEN